MTMFKLVQLKNRLLCLRVRRYQRLSNAKLLPEISALVLHPVTSEKSGLSRLSRRAVYSALLHDEVAFTLSKLLSRPLPTSP